MRVLILGGSGQLGQEVISNNNSDDLIFLNPKSSELNITKKESLLDFLNKNEVNIVLNLSAFTNVDLAETNYQDAFEINALGVENLTDILTNREIPLIHISTDYVFGNNNFGPYQIHDNHSPINNYGKSKAEGEKIIIKSSINSIIIRTASLYGSYGDNFLKTFVNKIINEKEMKIISDQQISLTWSYDLSKNIIKLLSTLISRKNSRKLNECNILHLVNTGYTNWFDVGILIKAELKKLNIIQDFCNISSIKSADWITQTPRPLDSRLVFNGKIENLVDLKMPVWNKSLIKAIHYLVQKGNYEK